MHTTATYASDAAPAQLLTHLAMHLDVLVSVQSPADTVFWLNHMNTTVGDPALLTCRSSSTLGRTSHPSLLLEEHIVKPAEAFHGQPPPRTQSGHCTPKRQWYTPVVWDITEKCTTGADRARSPKFESPIKHTRLPGHYIGRGNILVAALPCLPNRLHHNKVSTPHLPFSTHVLAYLTPSALSRCHSLRSPSFILSPEPLLQTNKCEHITACITVHNALG